MSNTLLRSGISRLHASPVPASARWTAGLLLVAASVCMAVPEVVGAQVRDPGFTVEQIMSPAFPYGLVSAKTADRIAWIQNERGMRNVYTAAASDFTPVRLTSTLEDDGVGLTSLQISDDGSVVVFIRGHTQNRDGQIGNRSSDAAGGSREVWAASTSGARPPWRVVAVREGDIHLSPDGRWVLYVKDGQVHRAAVDPGNDDAAVLDAASPLFVTLGENSDPVWSPDGKKIAFVTSRYDQRHYFPSQGHDATHSFIAVYDMDSRRISYMAPAVDLDTDPVWSPDGERIAFIRRPGLPFGHFASAPPDLPREQIPDGFLEAEFEGGYTLGVWVADVESGEARELWHNPPGDSLFVEIDGIHWTGDHILFTAEPNGWRHWFSVSVADPRPEPVLLTPGEGEVEHATFSPDGSWLYYTANIGGLDRRDLWRVPVAGGDADRVSRGPMIETFPATLASGRQVAILQSGPRRPLSVVLLPSDGGTGQVVGPELPSDFPTARHVEPRSVTVTAADGVEAHSILFLPPDLRPGERHPALVFIHGGPREQNLLGYHYEGPHGFYHMAYAMNQYLANQGYIVLSVNYRAGIGYGRAFRNPPETRAAGNSEYRDILAAGRWLQERPDVDPQRIGVWGLSYGGWLTGQALSRNSDLFKAGVVFAGVQMRSDSLDPDDLAYQSSPAYNIEQWTSPVLVIHGDDDRNVEFSQTVGLIQLLRAHEIPHELIVYPDDTHYFGFYSRWIKAFNAVDDFFDRRLIQGEGLAQSRLQPSR